MSPTYLPDYLSRIHLSPQHRMNKEKGEIVKGDHTKRDADSMLLSENGFSYLGRSLGLKLQWFGVWSPRPRGPTSVL